MEQAMQEALQRLPSQELRALVTSGFQPSSGPQLDSKTHQAAMLEEIFRQHQSAQFQKSNTPIPPNIPSQNEDPKESPVLARRTHSESCMAEGRVQNVGQNENPTPSQKISSQTTDRTTESDSEKDAAESYVSRKGRQGADALLKAANTGLKRPNIEEPQDRQKFAKLQHFNVPGSCQDVSGGQHIATDPKNTGPSQISKQDFQLAQVEPLQNLANILRRQQYNSSQALSDMQSSPFQDKPMSSPSDAKSGDFRSCFSEGSAHKLLGSMGQEGSQALLANLQRVANSQRPPKGAQIPNNMQIPNHVLAPLLANPNLANFLAQGAGNPNSPFRTVNSNVASDLNFDVSRILSYGQRPVPPMYFSQASSEALGAKMEPVLNASEKSSGLGGSLGAFGSIISGSEALPIQIKTEDNKGKSFLDKIKSKPSFPSLRQSSPNPNDLSGGQPDGPDPRILEWVLGHRPTITDRGNPGRPNTDQERYSGKDGHSGGLVGFKKENPLSAGLDQQGTTLRRPVAIRANAPQGQEPSSHLNDGKVEALLSKLHSAIMPPSSSSSMMPPLSKPPQKWPDMGINSSDMGRVIQWASQELALRDNKVREAERQRDEERVLHDAAMNAVAKEVMRIKAGQQELAKTHWNLQDLLAQRTGDVEEKAKVIENMSSAYKELEQQNADNVKEIQLLKDENKSLLERLSEFGAENGVPKKEEILPVLHDEAIQKEDPHDKVQDVHEEEPVLEDPMKTASQS